MRISDWSSDVCSSDLSGSAAWHMEQRDSTTFSTAAKSTSAGAAASTSVAGCALSQTMAARPSAAAPQVHHGSVPPLCLVLRSEEHTSELQSLMRISYAVFCLKKKNKKTRPHHSRQGTTYMHASAQKKQNNQ